MNTITWLYPAPWSPLTLANPARAYVPAEDTDVRRTWQQHAIQDDYDLVQQHDWLEMGGFR